ncbi:MAG: hypothetical protein R6U70_02690, partial [Bacillota bacterium]
GELIGRMIISMEQAEEDWLIIKEQIIGSNSEITEVLATGDELLPRSTDFSASLEGQQLATYNAEYTEDRVFLEASRPDGPQSAEIRLPSPPYYDNEQFIALLRTLPLEDGFQQKLNLIITRSGSKTEITVRVVGEETVSTPVGQIPAWKVELVGAGQYGWYETEAPHRLVRYYNVNAETTTLLTDYSGGGQ